MTGNPRASGRRRRDRFTAISCIIGPRGSGSPFDESCFWQGMIRFAASHAGFGGVYPEMFRERYVAHKASPPGFHMERQTVKLALGISPLPPVPSISPKSCMRSNPCFDDCLI